MIQHAKCPFCGLTVLKDDSAQTIMHEDPECKRFTEIASSQPHEERVVQAEAVGAHFEALARRVAARKGRT